MEQNPIQIAKIIKENGLTGYNHGLMHGNTGICIFFYHLARSTNNLVYENIASELLDKVFESFCKLDTVDFENGLAGIGWGIEYLVQNNFVEGNTDEILEHVDNKVFKVLNEDNHTSFELANGLTGYLFYLINRLKDSKAPFSMAQLINRELLILTINKIDVLITAQFPTIVKEIQFDLFWRFPIILFGLKEAFKLNIYNEKIRIILRQWLPNFEVYIPSLHTNRLFLSVVLKQIYSIIPDKRFEKQIQILLFATDFEVLKTEIDYTVLNIRYGWRGVALLLNFAKKEIPTNWPTQQKICQTYQTVTKRYKNPQENLPQKILEGSFMQYGLTLGRSGVGLTELLWPGILYGNFVT